jgi:hypothetical protein
MKILSIDAWGSKAEGYEWNQWFHVGDVAKEVFETLKTDKAIAIWMKENGFTTNADMRKISMEDDGYNVVLTKKKTGAPVFAIEYGPEY